MIETHLEQLGFSPKEVQVMVCLFESGELSASEISSRCAIARSTVYTILESLTARNVVQALSHGSSARFRISSPSSFLALIEKEKEDLERRERTTAQLVELLRPMFSHPDSGVPRMRFYSGKEAIEQMLFDYLESWRKAISRADNTWWGYQDEIFVEQYQRWFAHAWKTTGKTEYVKLFSNECLLEQSLRGKTPGREIRFAPTGFALEGTVWVLGDYIVMISSKGKPHYALQLNDQLFAQNLKTIFEMLWQLTG